MLPQTVHIDYTGEFQERTDLDCSVQHEEWKAPKPTLPAGRTLNVNVVYNASFPFETWGYAEYSFMQRELKQSFINDNQDPALELGVSRVLNAKYTPGPVAVGMPKETQPYAYDATAPIDLPPFGVTFSNAWMGKGGIVKFTSLRIYVPEYFELDASQCLLPVAPSNTVKKVPWDENTAYNYYEFENIYLPPAETFVTIKCPLRVIEPNKILGSSGAGKYTFFVQANYDYYLTMTTPVMLRRDPVKPEPNAPCQANTLTCKSGGMDCTCLYQDINKYSWQCRATMEGLTTACEPNTLN